jgi:P4 family phage/plasmid primase-like protien
MTNPTETPTPTNEFMGIQFTTTKPDSIAEPVNAEREAWKQRILAEEIAAKLALEKSVFLCFEGVTIPDFQSFCPVDENEKALGYGGSAKQLGFKSALVAKYIAVNFPFKTDIKTGILYFYNKKTWLANAEPYLEHLVNILLGQEFKVSHYNNILFVLKATTYQTIEFSQKLACENGLLDVETLEFKEYDETTKDEMPFHYIPVKYDPAATCPQWEEFIKEVITADDIETLQQWSGYLFLPDYRFHKLMWIVGSGRNGKGVWQRTQERLLGYSNISHLALEEFDGNHKFGLMQLYGKLFNPCSEPQITKYGLATNLLKYATGQDCIEAEIKNGNKRIAFTNCAKITVLANKFPRVNDQTTAFRERRLFLNFPNEFLGKDVIANIEKNWLQGPHDERAGILNWNLKGLQSLLCQGYFTTSKTQEETELAFLRHSDSVSAFINETATYNKNVFSTRADAQNAYKIYCEFYDLEVESEKKLCYKLKETPHIKDTAKRLNGVQQRVWEGVNFKVLAENDEISDSEAAQKTLDASSVTAVTANTANNLPLISSLVQENIGEGESGVFPVTSVTVENTVSNATKPLTIYFEALASNDVHKCDGLVKGHDCGLEAQFKTESGSFYCISCLRRIGKECNANGFTMLEKDPKENLDGERF